MCSGVCSGGGGTSYLVRGGGGVSCEVQVFVSIKGAVQLSCACFVCHQCCCWLWQGAELQQCCNTLSASPVAQDAPLRGLPPVPPLLLSSTNPPFCWNASLNETL